MDVILPAYYVGAGVALFATLQFAWWGSRGHRTPLYLAFAANCLCIAVYLLSTAVLYRAPGVAAAAVALKVQTFAILVLVPTFFAFAAQYTEQKRIRPWLLAVTGVSVLLVWPTAASEAGLRFTTLVALPPLSFPWGETLNRYGGDSHPLNFPLRLYLTGMLGWALWRTWCVWRDGRRRPALLLLTCLVLIQLASMHGALIDHAGLESFYTAGFAYLGLAVLMSVSLGMDLRDGQRERESTIARLEQENLARREAESRARRLAQHDELTGLPNRAHVQFVLPDMLASARRRATRGALIHVDLDHFRIVDNALGHEVGDGVLVEVARRLTDAAADGALAARLGADEFLLLLAEAADGEAEALAAALTRRLAEPIAVGEHLLTLGASIGIAGFPEGEDTAAHCLRRAAMALHRAKELGRNTVCVFQRDLAVAADARLAMERGLRAALANGELAIHFQPQVDAGRRPAGAEVLVRWHPPGVAAVPPSAFIPLAEATGLIHAIGEYVLESACAALGRWRRAGAPHAGRLSINLSAWQLARPDLPARLAALLARHGIAADAFTLEVTESALLHDADEIAAQLRELRAMGFRIALDDFGTGYSSLAYLHQLPLDELKIDQSFVGRLAEDRANPLVEVIVAAGRQLGLTLVAEGVETEGQARVLSGLGCHCLQGYLPGRPMPEAGYLAWLARQAVPA